MGNPPADLMAGRSSLATVTGLPVKDIGIAPDEEHLEGGGYHVGAIDLKNIGKQTSDYSARQARDQARVKLDIANGRNDSSAMDIGSGWTRGDKYQSFLRFNKMLLQQLQNYDPQLPALRGINFTLDGKTKHRYDRVNASQGVIASTDTVLWHTHAEFFRDTIGTANRALTLDRMVEIATAAVNNTSLTASAASTDPDGFKMIFTVTQVPAGTVDITGAAVQNTSRCLATPSGPFALNGDEAFGHTGDFWADTITITWARLINLCMRLKQPAVDVNGVVQGVLSGLTDTVRDAVATGVGSIQITPVTDAQWAALTQSILTKIEHDIQAMKGSITFTPSA